MRTHEQIRLTRRAALGGIGGLVTAGVLGRHDTAASAQTDAMVDTAMGIADAAVNFLELLLDEARARATYAFADAERVRWHWTTPSAVPRNGLPLVEMTPEQRDAALALLAASLSETGLQKALDIMSLQRDLGADPELYYVTIFGDPTAGVPWGWRFEGHHLSHHFAVSGDTVTMTPFFLGAWPTVSSAGLQAMEREEAAARELVQSLLARGRGEVMFQDATLTDHVTQNQPRVNPLTPVGLPAGDLRDDEAARVDEIVATYLAVLPPIIAAPLTTRLDDAGRESIRFGWAGSIEPFQPHYYRLQGPTFLLEFDNSRNGGTHIHSVWRDFDEDFGQPAS